MQLQCTVFQEFDCIRFSQVTPNNARRWPTSGNQYGGRQTGSSCISGTGRDINEILTATCTFSITPYSMESLGQRRALLGVTWLNWVQSNPWNTVHWSCIFGYELIYLVFYVLPVSRRHIAKTVWDNKRFFAVSYSPSILVKNHQRICSYLLPFRFYRQNTATGVKNTPWLADKG